MTRPVAPMHRYSLLCNEIGDGDRQRVEGVGTRVHRTYVGELGGPTELATPPDLTPNPSQAD